MVEHIHEVAKRLIDGLAPEIGVVRLYAYGSRVRGDADPGSDLDLLVELRKSPQPPDARFWIEPGN